MTADKITDEIIFSRELDGKILKLERKFKDDIFYAKDIIELGKAEDNFLKALKDIFNTIERVEQKNEK